MNTRAVVLLSGGLDSATALAHARAQRGLACHALSLDYGQRHRAELAAARRVSRMRSARASIASMHVDLGGLGGSALTDRSIAVPEHAAARAFRSPMCRRATRSCLCLALAWAEVLGAAEIVIGVNAVDYSGYPDCRPEFIAAFETLATLATKARRRRRRARDRRAAHRR